MYIEDRGGERGVGLTDSANGKGRKVKGPRPVYAPEVAGRQEAEDDDGYDGRYDGGLVAVELEAVLRGCSCVGHCCRYRDIFVVVVEVVAVGECAV